MRRVLFDENLPRLRILERAVAELRIALDAAKPGEIIHVTVPA